MRWEVLIAMGLSIAGTWLLTTGRGGSKSGVRALSECPAGTPRLGGSTGSRAGLAQTAPDGANRFGDVARRPGSAGPSGFRVRAAVALAALGVWCLIGGPVGLAIAALVAVALPAALKRLESRGSQMRRERLTALAPSIADLLSAALASGATLPSAMQVVSLAIGDPADALMQRATARLQLGAEPRAVWESIADERPLAPIARAATRADQTGAPLADILLGVADDLRQQHRSAVEAAARAVGVRAVGPLGACFLPAFILLGVVPLVASLIPGVLP